LGLVAASTARLTDALRQLREVGEAGEGHSLRIDHAGQALRSYRGLVYWEAGDSSEPADETAPAERAVSELAWQGEAIWRLPQWRGTFVFVAIEENLGGDAGDGDAHGNTDAAPGDPDTLPVSVLRRALLSARSRSGGERMRTSAAPGSPSRTLKNLFQERGIPAWKRDVPLLYVGDDLLFVPLLGLNRAVVPEPVNAAEQRVRISWRDDLLIA
jgi:tRNA(Ile)-lysidine synthase